MESRAERAAVEAALLEAEASIAALHEMLMSLWIDVRQKAGEDRAERVAYREFCELYEYLRRRKAQELRRTGS